MSKSEVSAAKHTPETPEEVAARRAANAKRPIKIVIGLPKHKKSAIKRSLKSFGMPTGHVK